MNQPKMIENEQDLKCQHDHGQPIVMVVLDSKLDKKQRLLCNKCINSFQTDSKTIGFQRLIQIIEDMIHKNMNSLEDINQQVLKQLESCILIVQELKAQLMKLFDSIITIAQDWTQNLLKQMEKCNQFSFNDELDYFIKNQNIHYDSNITLINNINRSWITKLSNHLDQYIQDKDKLNFSELKQKFMNIDSSYLQEKGIESKQNQIKINSSNLQEKGEIKLNLIDQSVKQIGYCYAIVFDSSGSIMVSTENKDIKVWRFLNGKFALIKTLQGHTNTIYFLFYSKKSNSFISGGSDKAIRCWKQQGSSNWICSQPYQYHASSVYCIILNSNEDLLFSGCYGNSIKVWKVDFKQNNLEYLYSLDKHNSYVAALSLNQSETQLVSCAKGENQIIIWERRKQDQYEFKYFVKQSIKNFGLKIKFLKENQFIWVTGDQDIDKLFVFELEQGVFKENQEKKIQLIANNQDSDFFQFPILYNNQRNLVVLRHKKYIYIIREMNDGKFKIVGQLNCDTREIYGTITNDGQYLVYWDDIKKGYSTYELQTK